MRINVIETRNLVHWLLFIVHQSTYNMLAWNTLNISCPTRTCILIMDEKIGIYRRYVDDISCSNRLRYDKLLQLSFDGKII